MFGFLRRRNTDPKARLARVLGECELPSFRSVVLETLSAVREPTATPASVARILESDPGLSVKLLKTVNSAAYSLRRQVHSLPQAIAILGIRSLESLVLSLAVSEALPRRTVPGFDAAQFWSEASRRAVLSRAISDLIHPAQSAESFTAGLLQDLAIPLLATSDPKGYAPILAAHDAEGPPLHERERDAFGWDHAEVGTWVCNEWGLPESLAAAIGAHHGGTAGGLECLPAVSLATLVAEDGLGALARAESRRHGIEPQTMGGLVETSAELAKDLARLFGFESS